MISADMFSPDYFIEPGLQYKNKQNVKYVPHASCNFHLQKNS
jgi:hypothetical protein